MNELKVAWSRPAEERAGTRLVVALHGRGADERSMLPLAAYLGDDVTVAAPRGPVALGTGAYTWFENRGIGRPVESSISASAELIFGWLDAAASGFSSVVLLGFSGGTAMGGGLLLREPERFSGSLLLSGTLPWDAGFDTSTGRLAGRPVFFGYDPADAVIPPELIARSVAWLRDESGATLSEHAYPGVGHGISNEEIADIRRFVAVL
jgi:phospholipase/carboxylesterase